jgi:tetratricopeptide (TPR) repeat protein
MVTLLSNIGKMNVVSGASDDAVRDVARRLAAAGVGERATDPRAVLALMGFAEAAANERHLLAEAAEVAEQGIAAYDRLLPHELPEPLTARALHARLVAQLGRKDQAQAELDDVTRRDGPPPHAGAWSTTGIRTLEEQRVATRRVILDLELARSWKELARPDLAEPLLQEGISIADKAGRRPELERCVLELIDLYKKAGRTAEAADLQARLDKLPPEEASAKGP